MTDWSATNSTPERPGRHRGPIYAADLVALLLAVAAALFVASAVIQAATSGLVADRYGRFALATQAATGTTALLVVAAVLLVRSGPQRPRSGWARIAVMVGLVVAAYIVLAGGYETLIAFTKHGILPGPGVALRRPRVPATLKVSASVSGLAVLTLGGAAAWLSASSLTE